MVLMRAAAAAGLVMALVVTVSHSFVVRKIVSHPKFLDDNWEHGLKLKMVTAMNAPTSTTENLIGIDAVLAAVDDEVIEMDDFTGVEKIQQVAVTNFRQLLNAADIIEFSSLLKQMAAKRRRLQESDRPALARAVIERLDLLNDELFSDCVWSIGTLRCNVNDFSAISSTVKGKDTVQHFWEKVARVSETANRLCFTRLAIGLGKMGLRWDGLPSSTRVSLIKLIQDQPFPGDVADSSVSLESRELATVLFTLGQLGVTTELLPEGSLPQVLEEVAAIAHNFTPQGLSNALHGLARMGVLWADLSEQAQAALPLRGAVIVAEMRSDELCSIMQSMAVMKVQWSSLPESYRSELLTALEATLPSLHNRELSNIFWALGKTNVNHKQDLSNNFRETLMDCLVGACGDLKPFDLESVFVGLGLMQVDFQGLSAEAQAYLVRCVERHLPDMNIFCTYNVLWGLARMGTSTAILGPSLSSNLLEKVVTILHTFLPTQYGDVIWSLGSLGFRRDDLSPVMSDRLLAVLSRVYGKLHVRAAAYTLWGLSKMGFHWEDMRAPTRSLAGGREAEPLSESVNKYLRQRVASMREHEYSVLLYSLGGLRVQLQGESELSLPSYVTDKIHHRATRVTSFLTSRSLANALYGLGKCGVRWVELPPETRNAWEEAMLRSVAAAPAATAGSSRTGDSADRVGLSGMRSVEFAQTLYGLGQLQVPWRGLSQSSRDALYREVQQKGRVEGMDLHSLSSGLWGFAAMGCPLKEVPSALLYAVRRRLLTSPSTSGNADSNRNIVDRMAESPDTRETATQPCDATTEMTVIGSSARGSNGERRDPISDEDYNMIRHGLGSNRQHSPRRVVLTSIEEAALSLTMSLDAMAMLQASLTQEEIREVATRLHLLALHMGPDSIVTCTGSLCQLGALWTDLGSETRVTWISRLKRSPADLTASRRQELAVALSKMGAF